MQSQPSKQFNRINHDALDAISKSLSTLIDKPVKTHVASFHIDDVSHVELSFKKEEMVAGIHCPVSGDLHGASLLVFPKSDALKLSDALVGRMVGSTQKLSRLDEAVLEEVGNIISTGYFNVLGNSLDIDLGQEAPSFSWDMFGAIVEHIISNFVQKESKAIVVEIKFEIQDAEINGYFLLLFGAEQIESMMDAFEG
jgi:chemotaxis protein CheC